MMDGDVRARLAAIAGDVRLHRRLVRVAGKGESAVEEIVQPIYSRWLGESPPHRDDDPRRPRPGRAAPGDAVGRCGGGASALDRAVAELSGGARRGSGQHRRRRARGRGRRAAARARLVGGVRRIVHRRARDVADDRHSGQLRLRRAQRRRVQQSRQDRTARCAGGDDRRARRGQRAGGAGDGGRHPQARRRERRRRHHRHCRAGRRQRAEAGRHGVHRGRRWRDATASVRSKVRTFRFPGGREMVKAMSANWAIDMLRRYPDQRASEGVRRGGCRRRRAPRGRRAWSAR